jgi:hypothetical protein
MSFRKWFGLGPSPKTEKSRHLAIEVARELAHNAESLRRHRCLKTLESEVADVANGGASRLLPFNPPRQILPACSAALPHAQALPGNLPTWLPQILMAADSVVADMKHITDPTRERGMAMAEVYGELMIMLCAGLELCDLVVAEVQSKNPGLTFELGTPGETELSFRKHLGGRPIPLLIQSRQVSMAIGEEMARNARSLS